MSCGPVEVADPFYLDHIPDSSEVALYRCPDGPAKGCAIDGLPGPQVIAAGGSDRFIVVHNSAGYYYFARTPQEKRGWGNEPEKIVGPLTMEEFEAAKRTFDLPDLKVRL